MNLSEAAKEARRKYDREYYAKNPEKQKEKMRRYWERKAARLAEESKAAAEKAETSQGN